MNSVNSVKEGDDTKEGFRVAPTRAAECKCLPGYVPSKDTMNKAGNVYTMADVEGTIYYFFIPNGTSNMLYISPANSCGIKHIYKDRNISNQNLGNYPPINMNESNLRWTGNLTCDMLKTDKNTTNSSRYRCQNLEDPSNTKECY